MEFASQWNCAVIHLYDQDDGDAEKTCWKKIKVNAHSQNREQCGGKDENGQSNVRNVSDFQARTAIESANRYWSIGKRTFLLFLQARVCTTCVKKQMGERRNQLAEGGDSCQKLQLASLRFGCSSADGQGRLFEGLVQQIVNDGKSRFWAG